MLRTSQAPCGPRPTIRARRGWAVSLRRTSIDELPQLINVLLGEMSLVGPRPERPVFVEQFRQVVPRYMERHAEKAGMTGLGAGERAARRYVHRGEDQVRPVLCRELVVLCSISRS